MSIKPELVERDENGYWAHSQIPVSEDIGFLKQWFDNNCLEIYGVCMDGDIDESHPTFKRYFIDGDCDISGWVPSKPQGDGWFIGGIFESEYGPVCSWLRPDVAKLKAKFLRAHKEAEKLHLNISAPVMLVMNGSKLVRFMSALELLHA
ncbi:hypothetical protein AB7W18_03315 [Providencia rettgeri]